ncbi:hypothetical protein [Kiloniella antarctica]|uniref:HTH CENPB-type domain-containing protein n=1 Tax=Kiloniella antarctica TaxID=1550907 RepID=A0ABW5BNI2_9PROT
MKQRNDWNDFHRRHRKALEAGDKRRQHETYPPLREATHDALREYNRSNDEGLIKSVGWMSKFQQLFGKERGG